MMDKHDTETSQARDKALTGDKANDTSDATRTGADADEAREKLVEKADQHQKDDLGDEPVVSDPANDWPAA
jgi:hypothetical protein